jgi:uncharacterized protein with von Willebrand factor type A (vWA) domain
MLEERNRLGGVIHTYQGYDPAKFPSPTQPPPDLATPAMEHLLRYGNTRRLTPEELARAIRIDPSQIAGLGPSIEALKAILEERKRKILSTYETMKVQKEASKAFEDAADRAHPPDNIRKKFDKAVAKEQLADLENLWYSVDEKSPFARQLIGLVGRLGEKYEVDLLAAKYEFTGEQPMNVPQALLIKEELEKIDELLKQLEEAEKTAQIGVIDMDLLSEFAEPGDVQKLSALQQQIQEYLKNLAEEQGLEESGKSFRLTPKAYRLFQGKLLELLFSQLQAGRSGRHQGPILGEGAVETPRTKEYEFGDSIAHLDVVGSFINSMLRDPEHKPRLKTEDMIVHRTKNNPKAATAVLLDMSGSMRYDGQYIDVKRMGLALEGLLRTEFPGDYLQFIEMASVAKPVAIADLPALMPKPVTIYDPVVRLKADMSDPEVSEALLPPHFTNIQHAIRLARTFLANRDAANKQIVLITDGLPTAHFEENILYFLYPPDPRTEKATMREAAMAAREGIVVNIFLLQDFWRQSEEDVRFAHRLAESTKGRVVFTASRDLDRFVVWDYVKRKKQILG